MASPPASTNLLLKFKPSSAASIAGSSGKARYTLPVDRNNVILLHILLQFHVSDHIANSIFRDLASPGPVEPSLKKAILLRSLASELSHRVVSEKTLETLVLIEELDRENGGKGPSESLQEAYCGVVVECTVTALCKSLDDFLDALDRIWKYQLQAIDKSPATGLISPELRELKAAMLEASRDSEVRELLMESELEETLERVRVYLKEAIDEMKTSLLVVVVGENEVDDLLRVMRKRKNPSDENSSLMEDLNAASVKDNVLGRPPAQPDEENNDARVHVDKGKEILASIFPNSQNAAAGPLSNVVEKLAQNLGVEDNHDKHDAYVGSTIKLQDIPSEEGNKIKQVIEPISVPKTSLSESNPMAHTSEWGDLLPLSERLGLPSPKRDVVSPLRVKEDNKYLRRRTTRKWTLLEEVTLRKAVKEHGKGSWKTILKSYLDLFQGRTEVDLKDKWRNLTRVHGAS